MHGEIRTIAQQRAVHVADMLAVLDAAVRYGVCLGATDDPAAALKEGEQVVRTLYACRERYTSGSFAYSAVSAAYDYWHAFVYQQKHLHREGAE